MCKVKLRFRKEELRGYRNEAIMSVVRHEAGMENVGE